MHFIRPENLTVHCVPMVYAINKCFLPKIPINGNLRIIVENETTRLF